MSSEWLPACALKTHACFVKTASFSSRSCTQCIYIFTCIAATSSRVYANSPLKTTLPEHTCKRSLSVFLSGSNTRGLVVEHLSLFSGGRKRYWWIGDVSTPCAAGTLITEKSNTHTVQTCNVLTSVRVCLRVCIFLQKDKISGFLPFDQV